MFTNSLLLWIVGCLTNTISFLLAVSLEINQPISLNKLRTSHPWVRFSTDYVRCFCNLPHCVSTGYMCKSSVGGCYSNVLNHIDHRSKDYRGRHGCLEIINNNKNVRCSNNEEHDTENALTSCCYYDMCNHVDSPQTKKLINKTLIGEPIDTNMQQPIDYSSSQVWFRAATIAVPVCGAVILLVLICLAVKILQSENQHSTGYKLRFPSCDQQISSRSKHSCDKVEPTYDNFPRKSQHTQCLYSCRMNELSRIQVPLLIQNEINTHHSGNKNETNAVLNLLHGGRTINDSLDSGSSLVLNIEKIGPSYSKNNSIRDVYNEKCVEKMHSDNKAFANSFNL